MRPSKGLDILDYSRELWSASVCLTSVTSCVEASSSTPVLRYLANPTTNISLGGNDYVRLSIMAKPLVFHAPFSRSSAAPPSQRVVLLGFSPSTIESGPNRQSYQRCWCVPAAIALFVRTASSVRGAISRIPMDRASLLWVPSFISYWTS